VAWRLEAPEDFRVDEIALYPTSGEGEHTFVQVEKRLRTTEQVARDLARAAGARPRDVGYAGRKDRVAVATQWFSVPGLDPARALALEIPGAVVRAAARHRHKLRTGQLRGNRFRVALRGVAGAEFERAAVRLDELLRCGMPNRFGGQRFGPGGDNAERGRALLAGRGGPRDRRQARFLVSALQARVFNAVLESRPLPPWQLERGDLAVVHESGGLFVVEEPGAEAERALAFEISPTGPIFGTKAAAPAWAVAARERALLAAHGIGDPLRPPRGLRLRGARRALRARPREARMERDGDVVRLAFSLPAGSYATVLLEELFGAPASDDTVAATGVCSAGRQEV